MLTAGRRSAAVAIAALLVTGLVHDVGAFSAQPHDRPPPSTSNQPFAKPPPLTASDDPHTLLGLDRLSPPKDFAVVQRAYRTMARTYHPDVAVGPDASPEERERANFDFARINEAYEDLKARKDEESFEVVIMGGNFAQGKRDKRVQYKTSEKIRQSNPNRVNYDRIVELQKRKNLKGRSWRDPGEYDYGQGGRHNGDFGPVRRW
ncbi:hypothetical protein ACHAXT_013193 [Thalassiosira profunda]